MSISLEEKISPSIRIGFLITSTIFPNSSIPLSYYPTRSIFSADERFQQTLETIKSIKKKLPSSYVLLADNSKDKLSKERVDILEKAQVDAIIQKYDPTKSDSIYKAQGEAFTTSFGIEYLESLPERLDLVFKISGRYYLTDDFNLESYLTICKENKVVGYTGGYNEILTVLYAVPWCKLLKWKESMLQLAESRSPMNFEGQFYLLVSDILAPIQRLGVAGLQSVDKIYFSR